MLSNATLFKELEVHKQQRQGMQQKDTSIAGLEQAVDELQMELNTSQQNVSCGYSALNIV